MSELTEDIDNPGTSGTSSVVREEKDTMKILVATDIHLGYAENDPIRGRDSFRTFEEILQIAVANTVDFILLGGDLFHESKPSTTCYHECLSLLKRYCLGDKPVNVQFMSDPSKNFPHLKNPVVNYEDPNLNISYPVFSIHGNHDDPTGENYLSAMDLLADTGFINYFGKWSDLTHVKMYPLMMRKGETKLALYGLSHLKDERLSRLFREEKVTMARYCDSDDWFNMLVLHQNRAINRGIKNYIPETVLPSFLHLVIWGHEHECRIDPEYSVNEVMISQPGSSVATSLAIGESVEKFVGLLHIHKQEHLMHKIKLKTVRPFVYKEAVISIPEDSFHIKPMEYAKEQISEIVDKMLDEAELLATSGLHNSQLLIIKNCLKLTESPSLPLIRLVVNFTNENMMTNTIRMGQQYADKVANPTDMFSFKLKRTVTFKRNRGETEDVKDIEEMLTDEFADNISTLVEKYYESKNDKLSILSTRGLCEAVSRFVDRNDTDALQDVFKHQFNKTFEKLIKVEDLELNDESIDKYLEEFRLERNQTNESAEISNLLDSINRNTQKPTNDEIIIASDDDDDDNNESITSNTSLSKFSNRGAASSRPTRGRGSRGSRRARGRAK